MELYGERLMRAFELFREWCDLESAELEIQLEDLKAVDPELAEGVRRLLEQDGQASGRDDSDALNLNKERLGRWLAETGAAEGASESPASGPGMPERIGAYRVLGILGVGGMGVVYRAEQDSPRRSVAVKVVHPTSLSVERRKRLRQEAEILGRLEHPGIARIYSAGSDDFGAGPQPYFAMEYVEGSPLNRFCEDGQASTSERIELLVQVCEAVDYAHRLGIVHRDLKPDNVLVEANGQPRVLDFGVARSIEPGTDATSLRTEDGRLVGTLSYMSPEQVEGVSEGLTPACDVYSLGAMLFEALAGRTPHDLAGEGLLGALQVLQTKDPARLGALRRDLRGDVDRILAKALERDPRRRYASAGKLGADLERFLRKEPVHAREPSTAYELRRFVARNPALVAGLASTLLVLLFGVGVSVALTIRARAGERLAQQRSYVSSIRAVDADLRLGDSTLALENLEALPITQRGWEWGHLNARVRDGLSLFLSDVDHRPAVAVLDPEGPRVAFVRRGDLWVHDGLKGTTSLWLDAEHGIQVLSKLDESGRLIAADRGGDLWLLSETEDSPRRLVGLPEAALALSWCKADGEFLALCSGALWRVSMEGSLQELATADRDRDFLQAGYSRAAEVVVVSLSRRDSNQRSSGLARALDAKTGQQLWEIVGEGSGRAPSVNPGGDLVFMGTNWGQGRFYKLETGEMRTLSGQAAGSTRRSEFSPQGSRLFTSNGGRFIEVRSVPSGGIERRAEVSPLLRGDRSSEAPRAADSDGDARGGLDGRGNSAWIDERSLLIARSDSLFLWDVDHRGSQEFEVEDYGYDLRFSPSGRWLLVREYRRDWVLVDALLRREVARLPGWSTDACFSPDSTSIFLRSGNWAELDLGSMELLQAFEQRDRGPDSLKTLEGELDGSGPVRIRPTRIYNSQSGQAVIQGSGMRSVALRPGAPEFKVEQVSTSATRGVAWSLARGWIASANGLVNIYDDQTGELIAELGRRSKATYAVAFHPDGERLATGGADGEIVLWQTGDWSPVLNLRGHDLYVRALEFSPNGELLASASGDRSIRIWDTRPKSERNLELTRVLEQREATRSTVEDLIASEVPDLAGAIHRHYPPGPQREAALSWIHELLGEGSLPWVSRHALDQVGERKRQRNSGPETHEEAGGELRAGFEELPVSAGTDG